MKNWKFVLGLALLALVAGGCKGKEKAQEVSATARAEADQNFSEAEFATQIRDHARAEGLLVRAVELDPGEPNFWLHLGGTRKRLGNLDGAKKAYEKARELIHHAYEKDKKKPDPLFAEMEIWVLLGKPEEARRLYDQAIRDHADHPGVQRFIENRGIDTLLASPGLKEMSI